MKKARYIFLYPLSLLYAIGTGIRNLLFDWNVLKSKSFEGVKIINVGNLCAGGSGKTPHIEYLIKILRDDLRIATLSRGYKRKTSGYVLATGQSTAEDIGDEPLQFVTKNPDVMVAVDGNRRRGIQNLLKINKGPEVILLDDAFQHRSVKPGLNILLTDYSKLFIHDTYLPAGMLRESIKGSLRADIIVITKTPENASSVDMRGIMKDIGIKAYQTIYFSYLKYDKLYCLYHPADTIEAAMELYKYNVLLFTGIANDAPLLTYVKEYADDLVHKKYPDHYEYFEQDAVEIKKIFDNIAAENKIIITTEKDAMRLNKPEIRAVLHNLPLYVLPVEVDFKNKTEEFNENVLKYVRTNKIYHKKYM